MVTIILNIETHVVLLKIIGYIVKLNLINNCKL